MKDTPPWVQRLNAAIEAARMNASSVAAAAGLKPGYVYEIINGRSQQPRAHEFARIARVLGVASEDILLGPVTMSAGARLALAREFAEWTLDQAAEQLNVDPGILAAMETGKTPIPGDLLITVKQKAPKVSLDWLVSGAPPSDGEMRLWLDMRLNDDHSHSASPPPQRKRGRAKAKTGAHSGA